MNAERKIAAARVSVLRTTKVPALRFWGPILGVGQSSIKEGLPTAATDGRNTYWGREFVDNLSIKNVAFVDLHEASHKGFRHLTVYKGLHKIDPRLANMAMDFWINQQLKDADPNEEIIAMPECGCFDPKYRGMTVKQIFDALLKEKEEGGGGGKPEPGEGEGEPGEGKGSGDNFDEHDWEGASEMSPEEVKELEKEVHRAIRRGEIEARKAGVGKGGLPMEVGELLNPKVDWRKLLRDFMTDTVRAPDDSTYRRLNKRWFAHDLSMPSSISETVGPIVVAADLSGSMWWGSPPLIHRVMTEVISCANLTKPEKLDLLWWDHSVTGHEEYKAGDYEFMLSSMKPAGGGGTRPSCVPEYIKEKKLEPSAIIMITDGEVGTDWGKNWNAPVLWLIIDNPSIYAGNGKTIHINSNDEI